MAQAAVAALARRLRAPVLLQDSFLVQERRSSISGKGGSLVQSFGRVHRGDVFAFPSIRSCCRVLHGVPVAEGEGLVGGIGTVLVARSFATRSTQLRRLAKQPVKSDGGGGPRSGGRPIRDRAVARDAKRNSRHLDASDTTRSFANAGRRVDRSGVTRPRSFQEFQLRRRGLEDTEPEDVPVTRKRRVMRLHPSDQTNKRIVDDSPVASPRARVVEPKKAAKIDDGVADDASSSQNAQFRAIRPLPEILRHIDTHLLGRRRLWEWRKGGYHPKLKAPLDDVPHGSKEGRLPIQETVGLSPPSFSSL